MRLLWRAGFGPRPGDVERYAKLGMDAAVASLSRPQGAPRLIGEAPHDDKGNPLDPMNVWGEDHCWWLDRMVRSDHQLIERMTLVWHSWFATSEQASNAQLMINQNWMLRRNALGNFRSCSRCHGRSGDAAVAERQHQQQVLAQRELRARDARAVHARAGPRLQPGRRSPERSRADRLDQRLEREPRADQVPLRVRAARLRRKEDLRARRPLELAGQRALALWRTKRTRHFL